MSLDRQRRNWFKWPVRVGLIVATLLIGPLTVLVFGDLDLDTHWSAATQTNNGWAPHPNDEPEAVIQIYGARAYNWRGAFGIHTWIATKREGASHYSIHQVLGWNLFRDRSTVTISHVTEPDFAWYNSAPNLIKEHRGPHVEAMIARVEEAVAAYPYAYRYRVWPGPNSNTFTAFVARQVPELKLDLPPTAIGKDYLVGGRLVEPMPSGTGWQISLLGLLGIGVAWEEGIEMNILGLSVGVDLNDLDLRLPGIGRFDPFL